MEMDRSSAFQSKQKNLPPPHTHTPQLLLLGQTSGPRERDEGRSAAEMEDVIFRTPMKGGGGLCSLFLLIFTSS